MAKNDVSYPFRKKKKEKKDDALYQKIVFFCIFIDILINVKNLWHIVWNVDAKEEKIEK